MTLDEALRLARSPVRLPADLPVWLTPLVSILPAQLFTYHLLLPSTLLSEIKDHTVVTFQTGLDVIIKAWYTLAQLMKQVLFWKTIVDRSDLISPGGFFVVGDRRCIIKNI